MPKLSKDEMTHLAYDLEHRLCFLYIEWPDNPVPPYHWKTHEGRIELMESMGLDHLKAAAKLAENAVDRLVRDRRSAVVDALLPSAQRKIAELRGILAKKALA